MKMKNKVQGRLGYNAENERYGLLVSDLWENSGSGREQVGGSSNGDGLEQRWRKVSGRHAVSWRFGVCAGEDLRKETEYGKNLQKG